MGNIYSALKKELKNKQKEEERRRKEEEKLESTDAAPEVSHPRPTQHNTGRDATRCGTRRPTRLPSRRTASEFFFFFFFPRIRADSTWFTLMRLNSCRIDFNSRRTGLIRPKSGRIGHFGSYRPAADTGRKTAETGLEYGRKSRNLHSSFFFCESRHSMCFLRIF